MFKKDFLKSLSQRRALFKFISALALFQVGINTSRAQSDFYIPGSLINLFLRNKFPIQRQWMIVKLELSNPELGFIPKEQRLSINAALQVTLVDKKTFKGHIHCSSGFIYEDVLHSIKLKSPMIDRMDIDGLGEKESALLQQINGWASKLLEGLTVYEFKAEEKSFLNKAPKKIVIEESGIRLFF
jgi:hypothetical protein